MYTENMWNEILGILRKLGMKLDVYSAENAEFVMFMWNHIQVLRQAEILRLLRICRMKLNLHG